MGINNAFKAMLTVIEVLTLIKFSLSKPAILSIPPAQVKNDMDITPYKHYIENWN